MRILIIWAIKAAALFALPFLISSICIDSFLTAIVATLVLGPDQ